jgi:hypothetical protein
MTTANDPPAPRDEERISAAATAPPADTNAVQAEGPPPEPASIPVPPPPAPPQPKRLTPQRVAAEMTRLDRVLVVVVLVLSFFLGSFTANNSDLWMHLATGRLIAHGQYSFGPDPFAFTTEHVRWVNHSWLFDLVLYLLSGARDGLDLAWGGAVLVAFKAVLVTALAAVLLATRRPGQSLWIPAVCVALAVVAMSPRLLLQPTCVSFLFLGLTLFCLAREKKFKEGSALSRYGLTPSLLVLPPLFALWVNLDSWFWLGPLTVGLYLAGEALERVLGAPPTDGQATGAPEPGPGGLTPLRSLALVFVACLAACLLNPWHIHAFTLPSDLAVATASQVVREDPLFRGFQSPLDHDYLTNPGYGAVRSAAGLAYYPLVALGLLSFALNSTGWRWWRALIWMAFFLLSGWQARLIPFFAVVSAPITALNLQEYAARRSGTEPPTQGFWLFWSLGGRLVTVALGLVLLFVAFPGWLHPGPDDVQRTRHVAWQVRVDPSLRQVAERLQALHQAWRAQGVPDAEARGFNFHPDVANYCAWFAPDEKGFFDHRFQLFPDAVTDFVEVRRALSPPKEEEARPPDDDAVEKVFANPDRPYRINHLVLGGEREGGVLVVQKLWHRPGQWSWLYLDGRSTIYGWKDPRLPAAGDPFRAERLDLERLAFGPDKDRPASPPQTSFPQPAGFWDVYAKGPSAYPLEADEAMVYMQYFGEVSRSWFGNYYGAECVALWAVPAAGACLGGSVGEAALALARTPLNTDIYAVLMQRQENGPTGALFLAVQAARRAVAANPNASESYLALARALTLLRNHQQARLNPVPAILQELRHVQLATALRKVIAAQPETREAHLMLAQLYSQTSWERLRNAKGAPVLTHLDLAVEHFEEFLRQLRAAGPRPGPDAEKEFKQQLEKYEKEITELEKQIDLKGREERYQSDSVNRKPIEKAQIALRNGLAKTALAVLEELEDNEITPQEARLETSLRLSTGQVDKLPALPPPGPEVPNRARRDLVQQTFEAAALGDYRAAEQHLAQLLSQAEQVEAQRVLDLIRGQTWHMLMMPRSLSDLGQLAGMQAERTDWRVLRGLLALEGGDTVTAKAQFHRAQAAWFPPFFGAAELGLLGGPSPLGQAALQQARFNYYLTKPWPDFPLRPLAARYLRLLEEERKTPPGG